MLPDMRLQAPPPLMVRGVFLQSSGAMRRENADAYLQIAALFEN